MNDQLIPLNNATQIVAIYNNVLNDLHRAFSLIEGAKRKMKNTFGEGNDGLWKRDLRDYEFSDGWERGIFENCKARIKREAWSYIVDKTQIKTLLSIKRQEELSKQLFDERNENPLPEITEENIFSFINNTAGKAGDLVEEAIQEVFEILRPHKQYHNFKTNSEFEIGSKVFFEWWMDTSYGFCHFRRDNEMRAIDKLFHLLDGKPTPQYPHGVVTIIEEAIRAKQRNAETEYFKMSWFKKGSFHIEFKRLDLVKELNKKAGGMRLKGSNYASQSI